MNAGRRRTLLVLGFLLLALVGGGAGGCNPLHVKKRKGVYHTVRKGETLWRICYTYRVNMKTVCRVNGIRSPERIRAGQKIFIPGASRIRRVKKAAYRPAAGGSSRGAAGRGNRPKGHRKQSAKRRSSGSRTGARKKAAAASLHFVWPVKGPVTSWFGVRHGRRHDGIDIAAPKGTPIRAAEKGKVIYSDNKISGYGNLIIIEHAGGFHTVYAHNARNRVEVDEKVNKWQVIGEVGATGRATGPHLHFEIRKGRRAVDPMKYLP